MLACQPTLGLVSQRVLSPAGGKPLIQGGHQMSSNMPSYQSCRKDSVSKCWRKTFIQLDFHNNLKGLPMTSFLPIVTTKFTSVGTQFALGGTKWTLVEVMTMSIIVKPSVPNPLIPNHPRANPNPVHPSVNQEKDYG